MNILLRKVKFDEKEILRNLLEKYSYEFSEYTKNDVNSLGLYGYRYLDYYWTEKKRFPYFIFVDHELAGFVLVIDLPEVDDRETDFQMAEFFVMHKYRRNNVGKIAAFTAFDLHQGRWQLKAHPDNIGSCIFWESIIKEYTKDDYELIKSYPGTEYEDGTLGNVYFFETNKNK